MKKIYEVYYPENAEKIYPEDGFRFITFDGNIGYATFQELPLPSDDEIRSIVNDIENDPKYTNWADALYGVAYRILNQIKGVSYEN